MPHNPQHKSSSKILVVDKNTGKAAAFKKKDLPSKDVVEAAETLMKMKGGKLKMKSKSDNPWLKHLKSFYAKHKNKMSYKEAMKEAKKTYKKK